MIERPCSCKLLVVLQPGGGGEGKDQDIGMHASAERAWQPGGLITGQLYDNNAKHYFIKRL